MRARQEIQRLFDPTLALLIEIRREADVQQRIPVVRNLQQPQVRPVLINNPAILQRRRFHIELLMPGQLLEVRTVRLHGPQVHHAIAVRVEINPPLPPHRIPALAFEVRRQRDRLRGAVAEPPQVFRRAALVTFGAAALAREAGEEKVFARIVKRPLIGLGQRQHRALARFQVKGGQLPAWQGGKSLRGVEQFSIRCPTGDPRDSSVECPPYRQTTREGHRINLCRPFVLGTERQQLAVRRNRCVRLRSQMRRESLGHAALHADPPEIALGGEYNRILVQRRIPVIPARRFSKNRQRNHPNERQPAAEFHGA